ncbi:MAG: DeoR/GlpR family DNA-binding transcription regulator [Liquorilactobacillus satsumensis]|uniref:DeoR/GlpR family DNA-binding transcription regulator n=1 Tax=Liquorilactobacillus satsumensis TaxID=259059 RepID=UPI0039E931BA
MLKKERLMGILNIVNLKGVVTVNYLVDKLNVSNMTIRRDLDELSQSGKVLRIHGGAQSVNKERSFELSRTEKREIHITEKIKIATKAATLIQENDTLYIGPGTTLELVAKYLNNAKNLRVVTNSLPIFQILERSKNVDVIFIGGSYRERSNTFVGSLTNSMLKQLRFNKTLVGVNGIHNENLMTANPEEGQAQRIALNNAQEKIIVADHFKLNKNDFYNFYSLYDIDYLITNKYIDKNTKKYYEQFTKIILSDD